MVLGALPLACNSADGAKEDLEPSCSSGSPTVQCFAPGSTHFNFGNTPTPQPTPTPTFDANNCQIQSEVSTGCCNPAISGPELIDGECCYGFCTGACCGRPLLVEGEARVAPIMTRSDWLEPLVVDLGGLTPEEREELARQWQADAQLEHASVASFARFSLDLLAFGAPAELVELAQSAMGDEIRHARLCFGLASAYAGRTLGPAKLDLKGVTPSPSLTAAAVAAVREGCINETIAALAATEQAERAGDPTVKRVLSGIAQDEAAHAELAWRFVAWALSAGDPATRLAVQAALNQPVPAAYPPRSSPLRAHGRLTPEELGLIARAAKREVIAPCAAALA
jgi:hypothetical protein